MRIHTPLRPPALLGALVLSVSTAPTARAAAFQGLGTHDQFDSSGVTLLGWVHAGNFLDSVGGDDCWGYTSPSGREYAIYCATGAIGFVEITNPTEPVVVASIAAPANNWHDVKTYSTWAYAVSEGGSGIQVIDLSQIDAGIVTHVTNVTTGGGAATHNVAIDEASGFLYRCDGFGSTPGLRIYDLADPALPAFVGSWTVRSSHDAQVVTYDSGPYAGRQIGFLAADGVGFRGLTIVDLTDKQNVLVLGEVEYTNQVVSHQGWLSDDKSLFYFGDEADESSFGFTTRTHVFDVVDLENPTHLGFFTNGSTASDHNLYVDGPLVFEANFMSGLRVYDASASPTSPTEVAWFDVHTSTDQAKTEGLWSNYPFFPSGSIIGSDEVKGLFVWRLGPPTLTYAFPDGLPDPIRPDGEAIRVHVGEQAPGALLAGSPTLHVRTGPGVELDVPLVDVGGGDFVANVPASSCGQVVAYRFSARSTDGLLWRSPASTEDDYHFALSAWSESVVLEYDMEAQADWQGGQPGDTAPVGNWVRGVPVGTTAQTEIDRSPGGTACWFTGQGTAGLDNNISDVDGGFTTLLSPPLRLAGLDDPIVSYWRWYHNTAADAPGADTFVVQVSRNGAVWSTVEMVGPTGDEVRGGWRRHAFRVLDHVPLTNEVRVRFIASDLGAGSIVEAAVDDFRVSELACDDCNGNGTADATDIALGSSLDLDGNALPDECQALSADAATISLAVGGAQTLTLDAGPAHGSMLYWMFGSVTGTSPGTPLGAFVLPLNVDVYFKLTLKNPFLGIFSGFLSLLDPNGRSTAAFALPPASDPDLAGLTFHHAYIATATLGTVHFTSNAIPLTLLP